MSAISSPYGLAPLETAVSQAPQGNAYWYPLGSNNTNAIFRGDPVNISSGVVTALAATPTTTASSNTPFGIFLGAEWDNNTAFGGRIESPYLPASALTALGYTNVRLNILLARETPFRVQADGPVATTAVGKNAPLGNFGAGSTVTGRSKVTLVAASIATTNTLAVRIIGIDPTVGNVAGDLFTEVWCVWNSGVHALAQPLGQ